MWDLDPNKNDKLDTPWYVWLGAFIFTAFIMLAVYEIVSNSAKLFCGC
jgi:hypothetical protein